ncbi:hypothetical protein G9464_12450 [Halostella sp. JP-L12]|uniref:hypothetical protein n=1 Tax=Halostella TaxID=1843185 RepID=UPI0013CEE690|nr:MULTISPECIES: hypothetical protein [Halostella]NHN48398.1 hypothetical protein [Halostella sp. JP-L12]
MSYLDPVQIQELKAERNFRTNREDIPAVASSSVSDVVTAQETEGMIFDVDYDRAEHGGSHSSFPWTGVNDLLNRPSTVYDVPIRRMVVRFESEEFKSDWEEAIVEAIDHDPFPTEWIEGPFYAILNSKDPGEADARDHIRDAHEEFYYIPKSHVADGHDGLGWTVRSLDLEAIYSYQGFIDKRNPILTTRDGDREYDWTPRRLEDYIMNYFNEEESYVGLMHNADFINRWRNLHSTDMTSTKTFIWEADEEWVQEG